MKDKHLKTPAFAIVIIALTGGLVCSILASITFGNADISISDVYKVILYKITRVSGLADYGQGAVHDVVWLIRFPRVVMAVAVGM